MPDRRTFLAPLKGMATWLRMPRDRWPPEWRGRCSDPVCPMDLALYGHPDSGGYWEEHCDESLREVGFTPCPDWPSVYFHPGLNLMLSVYVDDFKLAGPRENLARGWLLIRSRIKTDDPTPVGRAFGCEHKVTQRSVNGVNVQSIEYDMGPFLEECVSRYLSLAGRDHSSLKKVPTPFLEEAEERSVTIPPEAGCDDIVHAPLEAEGNAVTAGTKPGNTVGHGGDGVLHNIVCKVLMKVLYAARLARFDLLRPIAGLATRIAK